ncbi:cytochrome c [Terrarubrum flagellatum]|uniref:c-type cytochrome n=1 Tax=Terrirubrum flagellatum TaxID=2895980 RepID=UPI0031453EDB
MKRVVVGLLVLAALGLAGFWIVTSPEAFALVRGRIFTNLAAAPDLGKGKTLFWEGGCASCHAIPKQDDRTKLGGGLALKSPFGTFYAPNISPHPRDGVGSWTVEQFARAMTQGVSPDGRHYYPAFPYTSYQRLSEADLRDLFGFLKTLVPVEGKVRDHDLPFPFNIRRTLGGWKWLFLDGRPFVASAQMSPAIARGAYLVEGPGHCAECHSPRNFLGGIIAGMRFSGGPDPEGQGTVPNITPDATGIKDYSKDDIIQILQTGLKPDGDSVGGGMGAVVLNYAQAPKADVDVMAEYLKSLAPIKVEKK